MSTCRNKRGMVLVISLWLIITIAIFGLGLSRTTYSQYRFTTYRAGDLLADTAVEGLLTLCKYERIQDLTPTHDTISEMAREEEIEMGSCKVIYSLMDEESRININKAGSSILENLPEMDRDKAVAIVSAEKRPFRAKEELLLLDEIDEETYEAIKD
ncbi:MAG: helix-hairpin-helix domain-containing protein, partial [Candidatus Omnitrophota bacterium]